MSSNPAYGLSQEELIFCKYWLGHGNGAEAYRQAFADSIGGWDSKKIGTAASKLLETERIKNFINWSKRPATELAQDTLRSSLVFGQGSKDAQAAAKAVLDREEKENLRSATERWAQVLCEIGAEVVYPLPGGKDAVIPFAEMVKSDFALKAKIVQEAITAKAKTE